MRSENQINLLGEYPEDPYKGWRRVYPELFGDKLPKGLRFVRFELCPISVLDHSSQDFRIGGEVKVYGDWSKYRT